jgi:hypothetical protein
MSGKTAKKPVDEKKSKAQQNAWARNEANAAKLKWYKRTNKGNIQKNKNGNPVVNTKGFRTFRKIYTNKASHIAPKNGNTKKAVTKKASHKTSASKNNSSNNTQKFINELFPPHVIAAAQHPVAPNFDPTNMFGNLSISSKNNAKKAKSAKMSTSMKGSEAVSSRFNRIKAFRGRNPGVSQQHAMKVMAILNANPGMSNADAMKMAGVAAPASTKKSVMLERSNANDPFAGL